MLRYQWRNTKPDQVLGVARVEKLRATTNV
jgi:hypothetical protein